jgi:hypothetical protein
MYANYSGCRSVSNQRGRDYNVRSRSLARRGVRAGEEGGGGGGGGQGGRRPPTAVDEGRCVREWCVERRRRWRAGRAVTSVGVRANAVAAGPRETAILPGIQPEPRTGTCVARASAGGRASEIRRQVSRDESLLRACLQWLNRSCDSYPRPPSPPLVSPSSRCPPLIPLLSSLARALCNAALCVHAYRHRPYISP